MEVRQLEYVYKDDRGELAQIISDGTWRQLNILKRRAGSLGGGHYHQNTSEFFYILKGNLEVKVCQTGGNSSNNSVKTIQSRTFSEGDCFTILPYEQHYMNFLTDTILVVLYTHPIKLQGSTDILMDKKLPSLNEVFTCDRQIDPRD